MISVRRGWPLLLGMVLVLLMALRAFGQKPHDVQQDLQQALKGEAELQKEVDEWSAEKQALLHDILDLKLKKQWLEYQNTQHQGYIDQKKEAIAAIQDRVNQVKALRMELEPYLERVVARLDRRVGDSPAFLPQERRERIDFLQQSLQEYGLDMSERLRRVLEALQVEAGYGTDVEVRERELTLDGEETLVRTLRMGRVALYYVTPDGQQAGLWNPESQTWSSLSAKDARSILTTMDMVDQKRAADLVLLPLRKPESGEEEDVPDDR